MVMVVPMPLKDMSEEQPKAPKEKKPKGDKKPKAEPKTADTESPWKTLPDGTRVRQGRKLPYEKELHQIFTEVSGLVAMADSFSAGVIENQAESLAYGYAKLAKDDPRVKAFFERLVQGSAYTAAIIPTVTVATAIAWHFGAIPAQLGVPAVVASGQMPYTREQEQDWKRRQAKEQAEAAKAEARATHPHGEAPKGDGDSASN